MDATAAFYQALADSEAEDAALLAANAAAIKPARRSRRVANDNAVTQTVLTPEANASENTDETGEPETYEFRWDVEIPGGERRYGQKFMKQWKRVLQVQKMSPLVSAKLAAHHARFQLCVAPLVENGAALAVAGNSAIQASSPMDAAATITAREAEIAEELGRFRWAGGGSAQSHIEGEPARQHPAGWQGVRVWMTFARRDVEAVLGKKPKL